MTGKVQNIKSVIPNTTQFTYRCTKLMQKLTVVVVIVEQVATVTLERFIILLHETV